jgi:hypothetical protein
MKVILGTILFTFTSLVSPSIGFADEVTGRIALVDNTQHTVMLTNGMSFFFPETDSLLGLAPGKDIKIIFDNGPDYLQKGQREDRRCRDGAIGSDRVIAWPNRDAECSPRGVRYGGSAPKLRPQVL